MEASVSRNLTIEASVLKDLKAIVGEENVTSGPEPMAPHTKPGNLVQNLLKVCPGSTEDVQAIVNIARLNHIAIITSNDRYLMPEDLDKEGIFLDFSRMNTIEKVDERNLIAHIERGVTWEQLNEEFKLEKFSIYDEKNKIDLSDITTKMRQDPEFTRQNVNFIQVLDKLYVSPLSEMLRLSEKHHDQEKNKEIQP